MKANVIDKYKQHFHNGDRSEIFKLLVNNYEIESAMYPGSYIHIAPSLYIPITVYIDSYKKAKEFFNDSSLHEFIFENREYRETPVIRFHYSNYNLDFREKIKDFDLLISQYAGFVSQKCKKYLKKGGILLVNNSHGDASMAHLDKDYELISVIYRSNRQYRLTQKNLDKYFIPKNPELKITKKYIEKIQRGVGYSKSASSYVFIKMNN